MQTKVNTAEKVKIKLSFDTIAKIKAALPSSSIARIAKELGVLPQAVTNEFNKVSISKMSDDRQSRLIDRAIIAKAIEIIQVTGNASFNEILLEPVYHEA